MRPGRMHIASYSLDVLLPQFSHAVELIHVRQAVRLMENHAPAQFRQFFLEALCRYTESDCQVGKFDAYELFG